MKILFLSGWYPNRIHPHLGNFVQRHAEAVSGFNETASLSICPDPDLPHKKFEADIKHINNVFTVIIYYKKTEAKFPFAKLVRYFQSQKAWQTGYREILRHFQDKPDVVHLNVAYPAGFFAMHLRKRFGIPFIITEHSTKYHLKIPQPEKYFTKKICKRAELICPVSNHLKEVMLKKGFGKNFEVVPNVVNTDLFSISDKVPGGKIRIIHISTLAEWQKNISGILRVIKRLAASRDDFEMRIISEKDYSEAKSLAEKSGLDSIIRFYPDQPIENVAAILRESDLLLLFSNYENSPCVIIESLASGVPVVSTNVGGIPELISPKNGLLVNPKDEDELYEQLNRMLDAHASYDKKDMRKETIAKFSFEVVGKKFTDIYRQILFKKLNRIGNPS